LSGGVLSLDRNGMRVRLIVMVAISVLLSVVAAGAIALAAFDRAIEPEMNPNTASTMTKPVLSTTPTANARPKSAGACEWP